MTSRPAKYSDPEVLERGGCSFRGRKTAEGEAGGFRIYRSEARGYRGQITLGRLVEESRARGTVEDEEPERARCTA
jgi:hypothetical protein